jgi:integrase
MVADYIRPVAVKLGVIRKDEPRFGFHNFRHSLATFLISEGQDPDVVRRMLRQSHIDTTLTYAHGFRENRCSGSYAGAHVAKN